MRRSGSILLASAIALATTTALLGPAAAAPTASGATVAATPKSLVATAVAGEPPSNYVIPSGNYFSYLGRTKASQLAIRNKVLNTVNSTWGKYVKVPDDPATPGDDTVYGRGVIRMATWSFGDLGMKNALVAARNRGVRVQVVAAASVNNDGEHPQWPALRAQLNRPSDTTGSFARQCSGACRGPGGTSHSKYFLFSDVGSAHRDNVVVQTSMNLTTFAWQGQWNQANVLWNEDVFDDFVTIFDQSASGGKTGTGYRSYPQTNVTSIFFPGGTRARDPILNALNRVRCTTPTSGGVNGRTRLRMINYAIYQNRGTAIAKKLRSLWGQGCNIRIIYSVSSRPVLSILRSRSGRGPIPMKQTVVKNRRGEIVKYNHSKWLAISGHYYGVSRGAWTVLPGSANWSDLSYSSDEQTQQFFGYSRTKAHFNNFDSTWKQKQSHTPTVGRVGPTANARVLASIPEQPTWGKGEYKYLTPEGD